MSYIFISYSRHRDSAYARKLANSLEERGFETWTDERIDYGTRWPHVIEEHVDGCSAFIVIMTPDSKESEWVQNELTRAQSKRKTIFPLLLEGNERWISVEATQYCDVRGGKLPPPDFYTRLSSVVPLTTGLSEEPSIVKTPALAVIPTATSSRRECYPPDVRSLVPVEGVLKIEEVMSIDMDGDEQDEIVVLSSQMVEDSESPDSFFDILKCDQLGKWNNAYHMNVGMLWGCSRDMSVAELTASGYKQVLLTTNCGTGGFLNYWLIGFDGQQTPEVLLTEASLFQGSVEVHRHWLVVQSGDKSWTYEWDGTAFVRGEAGALPVSNSIIVDYWRQGDKIVTNATDNTLRLQVGQALYLRRDKQKESDSDYSTRTLSHGNGAVESLDQPATLGFVAKKAGETHVTIIPDGYNWEGSLKITIKVVE